MFASIFDGFAGGQWVALGLVAAMALIFIPVCAFVDKKGLGQAGFTAILLIVMGFVFVYASAGSRRANLHNHPKETAIAKDLKSRNYHVVDVSLSNDTVKLQTSGGCRVTFDIFRNPYQKEGTYDVVVKNNNGSKVAVQQAQIDQLCPAK